MVPVICLTRYFGPLCDANGTVKCIDAPGDEVGGGCDGTESRWRLQRASGDAVGAVPATRWTLEAIADVRALTSLQRQCAGHGGFVAGAQRFDGP